MPWSSISYIGIVYGSPTVPCHDQLPTVQPASAAAREAWALRALAAALAVPKESVRAVPAASGRRRAQGGAPEVALVVELAARGAGALQEADRSAVVRSAARGLRDRVAAGAPN